MENPMPKGATSAVTTPPKPAAPAERSVMVRAEDSLKPKGCTLKPLAGSDDPRFNNLLLNTVLNTLWTPAYLTDEQRQDRAGAALSAVRAFNPRDEVEGMMAAQAVALHHAAMECARRAMLPEQPSDAADRLRRQAANMSRAMVDMAEAIDRRRGKARDLASHNLFRAGSSSWFRARRPTPRLPPASGYRSGGLRR
jgi:hypothetical protein